MNAKISQTKPSPITNTDEDTQASLLTKIKDEWNEAEQNIQLRPVSEYTSREFTYIFLTLVASGVLISTILIAPNIGVIFKLFEAKDSNDRRRIVRAIRKYKQRELIITKGGMVYTSGLGNRVLDTYKARNLHFKIPSQWSGHWYLVLFDIPGKYENERKIVREKLIDFGFKQYQDSAFISPHDCKEQIEELGTYLAITEHIKYLPLANVPGEDALKKEFRISSVTTIS